MCYNSRKDREIFREREMKMGELQKISGVGKDMEQHLRALGYDTIASLRGADPEEMYARECAQSAAPVDRCVLYVYRCAVYFAETEHPDPEKCKWWNWKD